MLFYRNYHLPNCSFALVFCFCAAGVAVSNATSQTPTDSSPPNDPIYRTWQAEATLRSICSVTENRLVAVGDRGTILWTADAGRVWRPASVPTSVDLEDVHFDGNIGWAVGGWFGKNTGMGYATLLRTSDGGETWQTIPSQQLPRLSGIRVQQNSIVCWGDYSPGLRSSVFLSQDGGLSWQPTLRGIGPVAAAAATNDGAIVAIDRLGRITGPQTQPTMVLNGGFPFRHLEATDHPWFLAGDEGQLLSTRDGQQWDRIALPLPPNVRQLCCWLTMARVGDHVWIAGNPGSVVFHSPDNGHTWTNLPTGQTLPIHHLHFVDRLRGWAVGAQGTLLATRDGGRSWYSQRQQPTRTGLLAVTNSSHETPWTAIAATVWDERQTAAIVSLERATKTDRADTMDCLPSIYQQAARQIGLSDFYVSPIPDHESQVANAKLAVQLLTWKPTVVLTSMNSRDRLPKSAAQGDPMMAIELATSDPFLKQLESLFLKPWQVQKLVSVAEPGRGEYAEQSKRVLRGSGLALWDILLALPESDRVKNERTDMRTLWARSQSLANHTDLMGGVIAQPETRLSGDIESLGNYQLVMGRVHRQRMVDQLVQGDASRLGDQDWHREFRFFVQSLPPREAADFIKTLAERLLVEGKWQHGTFVLQWLAVADNDQDTARWASLQLIQLVGSKEVQSWIHDIREPAGQWNEPGSKGDTNVAAVRPIGSVSKDSWTHSPFDSEVVLASAERENRAPSSEPVQGARHEPEKFALEIFNGILSRHPALRSHPGSVLQLASHYRETGHPAAARHCIDELIGQPQLGNWHRAAQQELAVLEMRELDLEWTVRASFASESPRLDGLLNERCWNGDSRMELTALDPGNELPAVIRWAYDSEYLYIGITCPRDPTKPVPSPVRRRTHDAELSSLDHVEIQIDADRDYATAIELAIAENGLTYDRCANFARYNPKWYVQVVSEPSQWRAEIAIPQASIVRDQIDSGTIWAVSARRSGPNRVPQTWSALNFHPKILTGNGLLVFE